MRPRQLSVDAGPTSTKAARNQGANLPRTAVAAIARGAPVQSPPSSCKSARPVPDSRLCRAVTTWGRLCTIGSGEDLVKWGPVNLRTLSLYSESIPAAATNSTVSTGSPGPGPCPRVRSPAGDRSSGTPPGEPGARTCGNFRQGGGPCGHRRGPSWRDCRLNQRPSTIVRGLAPVGTKVRRAGYAQVASTRRGARNQPLHALPTSRDGIDRVMHKARLDELDEGGEQGPVRCPAGH